MEPFSGTSIRRSVWPLALGAIPLVLAGLMVAAWGGPPHFRDLLRLFLYAASPLLAVWLVNPFPRKAPARVSLEPDAVVVGTRRLSRARYVTGFLQPHKVGIPERATVTLVARFPYTDAQVGVDEAGDGHMLLAALGFDPAHARVAFRAFSPLLQRPVLAAFALFVALGAAMGLPLGLYLRMIPFSLVILATLWPTTVTIGSDGVRIAWLLWRRIVPFTRIQRVEGGPRVVEIEQVGGRVVRIHNWGSLTGGNPVGDAIAQRVRDAMSFDGGDNAHKEAATSLLAVSPGMPTYRSGAVPVEILWRVVEDPTIVTEERAAAVRALAPSLDDEGKARLRIVVDAALSPELHDAIDDEEGLRARLADHARSDRSIDRTPR